MCPLLWTHVSSSTDGSGAGTVALAGGRCRLGLKSYIKGSHMGWWRGQVCQLLSCCCGRIPHKSKLRKEFISVIVREQFLTVGEAWRQEGEGCSQCSHSQETERWVLAITFSLFIQPRNLEPTSRVVLTTFVKLLWKYPLRDSQRVPQRF